jgi:large subunit ribosomal protein L9
MQVILLERVEKLGAIGDIVTVKNGFARNYLLPRNKALRANDANLKVFEANKAKIVADNEAKKTEAQASATGVDGTSVTLIRQASNTGQLYGSVAVRDIVEALVADGKKVGKNQVVLDKPIKSIGVYDVRVALHSEVVVGIKVNVARSPEEADLQSKGVDVMADMFEKDESGFTEDFDPNAEPGVIAGQEDEPEAAPAVFPKEAAADDAGEEGDDA